MRPDLNKPIVIVVDGIKVNAKLIKYDPDNEEHEYLLDNGFRLTGNFEWTYQ